MPEKKKKIVKKDTKSKVIKHCYEHHLTEEQAVEYLKNSKFETTLSYVKAQYNILRNGDN